MGRYLSDPGSRIIAEHADEVMWAVQLDVAPSTELAPMVDGGDPTLRADILGSVCLTFQTLHLDHEVIFRRLAIPVTEIHDYQQKSEET